MIPQMSDFIEHKVSEISYKKKKLKNDNNMSIVNCHWQRSLLHRFVTDLSVNIELSANFSASF